MSVCYSIHADWLLWNFTKHFYRPVTSEWNTQRVQVIASGHVYFHRFIQLEGNVWKMNTDVVKHKPKSKFSNFRLFQTSLLYQTREFFNNSTLHGVRYIAETGRPFGERYEFVVLGRYNMVHRAFYVRFLSDSCGSALPAREQ